LPGQAVSCLDRSVLLHGDTFITGRPCPWQPQRCRSLGG
jgi:hypothetical protein